MLKIKILPITFEIVTDECAENKSCRLLLKKSPTNMLKMKILPITFEIVTDEYAENKNLADYF